MLSLFRRFTKSRIGLIVVFLVLGVIALAFGMSDLTGVRSGAGMSGKTIAKVGDREITDVEVRQRVEVAMTNLRRRGQAITIEQFFQQGGFEGVLDQTINSVAAEEFANKTGMRVSTALVDGEIAGITLFHGVDGKFNQKKFDEVLASERITAKALREDMMRERYARWLTSRFERPGRMPDGVLAPYASLMLERRMGMAGLVRTIDMDPGAAPDDKALNAYYAANRARYMIPQRRVLRYAVVQPDQLKAQTAATEPEIAAAYRQAGARFAAAEKRSVRQLILADQASAAAVANQVRGGQSLADAARAAGLQPGSFEGVERAALAAQTSQAIAAAAFAATQGSIVGPVRSQLGWHVVQVEKIEKIPARSLDQARAELATEVGQRKLQQMLAALRQAIDDGIGDGATFDEIAQQNKLSGSRTPALTAAGINPDDPNYKPDPALAPIVRAGFTIAEDDQEPTLVQTGQDGSFALVGVERVVAAAPRPLAGIREQVLLDYRIQQGLQKARALAADIVNKVNAGTPLQQALAAAGVTRPPAERFDIKRSDLAPGAAAHVRMAFAMAPKKAKLVEAPDRAGYYVVYLDQVEQQDARANKPLMDQVRSQIAAQIGREHEQQFLEGIKHQLKITRNDAAIARLKAELTGAGVGR